MRAILFDLDNTLADTNALKALREAKAWDEILKSHLKTIKPFEPVIRLVEQLKGEGVKLGIVTNSPRQYADAILKQCKLEKFFDVVITFNDVKGQSKPFPRGIQLALEKLKVPATQQTLYVGDDENDVIAAYRAGITPVLRAWGKIVTVRATPALIVSSEDVLGYAKRSHEFMLIGERFALLGTMPKDKQWLFFLSLNQEGEVAVLKSSKDVAMYCLGRYFSQKSVITAKLHNDHGLSLHVAKKLENPAADVPDYWVDLIGQFLVRLQKQHYKFQVVTVIPSKPGQFPRLERLLERIKEKFQEEITADFDAKLLKFKKGSESIKTLRYSERQDAIDKNLKSGEVDLQGQKIVVIDDVSTTGTTMQKAFALLKEMGAQETRAVLVAKTVSMPEQIRDCPLCGSPLRLINGRRGPFWGCSTWFEPKNKCPYKEDA